MTNLRDPDALLAAYLAEGMEFLPERVVDSVLDEVHRTRQRAVFRPWRTRPVLRTQLGAAAVVAVLVVGGAFYATQRGQPVIGTPNPTPTVRPSQSQGADPTPRPSPSTTPLIWTPASQEEDWPDPVRSEPVGGGAIVQTGAPSPYPDPVGDVDASLPWIDIDQVSVGQTVMIIGLAVNTPPVVDPSEQWIAYGAVWDIDRDGIADLRFGVDSPEGEGSRAWITDLNTGRTVSNPGGGYFHETFYDKFFEPYWPNDYWDGERLKFGGDTSGGGGIVGGLHYPLYAWASVIQDGRVVATDYAPDAGWLDPEPWEGE